MRLGLLLALVACGKPAPPPDLQIIGESTRTRAGDTYKSPWFDGTTVSLVGARGETLGLQVVHHAQRVQLEIANTQVHGFDVESFEVSHPSTEMYGGSHGKGRYADGITPA